MPSSFSGVGKTGKGTIKDNGGDMSMRWSSPKEYYELPPNQILVREVNAPMKFCLDNFNSTKLGNCVLAPGDPNTAVHDLISVGMVRKTMLNITETVRGHLLTRSHADLRVPMPTSARAPTQTGHRRRMEREEDLASLPHQHGLGAAVLLHPRVRRRDERRRDRAEQDFADQPRPPGDQVVLAAPLLPVPLLLHVLERHRQQLPCQGRRRAREEVVGPGGALVTG